MDAQSPISGFLNNLPAPYDLPTKASTLDLQFQGHARNDCEHQQQAFYQETKPQHTHYRPPPDPVAKQTITRLTLRKHDTQETIGDQHNYFRPRPRLDSAWFQIPKPPRLAYHREKFFAQLLRTSKTAKRQKPRHPRAKAGDRANETSNQGSAPLYEERSVSARGFSVLDSQPQRIDGGVAGCKFTQMSSIEAPKRGKSWFRGVNADPSRPKSVTEDYSSKGASFTKPRLKVMQPAIVRPATTVPDKPSYQRSVGASVICLSPVDDEPKAPEADVNHMQQYREMRIMGDIHNRELASMRQEIAEVREAIEAQYNTKSG